MYESYSSVGQSGIPATPIGSHSCIRISRTGTTSLYRSAVSTGAEYRDAAESEEAQEPLTRATLTGQPQRLRRPPECEHPLSHPFQRGDHVVLERVRDSVRIDDADDDIFRRCLGQELV